MRSTMILASILCYILVATPGGCTPQTFPESVGVTSGAIDAIRDNTELTGTQKREALAAAGLDPVLINAVLKNDRTSNQFGGTLRTAFDKVTTSGRLDELTPDEMQLYSDAVESELGTSNGLTDVSAQAIVKLLTDNNLTSLDSLKTFIDDPANEIPADIPNDFLKNVLVEFNHDLLIPKLP